MRLRSVLLALLPVLLSAPAFAQAQYQAQIDRWKQQDQRNPPPRNAVVFTGSSSIRFWERMSEDFAAYDTIQRGFGGSQFSDLNAFVDELVLDYEPAAVVVFEGTNDIASGESPAQVFQDYLTFVSLVRAGEDPSRPPIEIVYLGITPTPSRWNLWPQASSLNAMIEAHADADPTLHYLDIPTPFLATGGPPTTALFLPDQLHLNQAGYDLWTQVVRPGLASIVPPRTQASSNPDHPAVGSRILIDFGPADGTNGNSTASPDPNGNHWNHWQTLIGGANVNNGEHIGDLRTAQNVRSGIDIVLTGECSVNGILNGGLLDPDPLLLGRFAAPTATQDYFFGDSTYLGFGFYLTGLDPNLTYDLRLFATRETSQARTTRYRVVGRDVSEQDVQTSGAGSSAGGGLANDDTIVVFRRLRPDRFGQLFVDVQRLSGSFSYLGILELVVRGPRSVQHAPAPAPR